jgi:MFS family permease
MGKPGAGSARGSEAWRLGCLFGALYFLQGIGEPTEGLIAQPARSLLMQWGRSDREITGFMALLGLPWTFKPLYGLLTDFVPIFGTRRKGYLLLAAGAMALGLLILVAFPINSRSGSALLAWLLVPAVAVALADVATDALMVERGQPLGLTGPLQAVQWGCLYSAGIVTGLLGGALCEDQREYVAFLVCGLGGALTFILVLFGVSDPARARPAWRSRELRRALAGARSVLPIGGFLFLWNFNPFSNSVLHLHMIRGLGLSERFYGRTVALTAIVSIAASAAYAMYCRSVRMPLLVHLSIVLGVVSTLGYGAAVGERSALVVTVGVAFTYMTATLIQLDMAARICPPATAGTVFALLMALENLSASASTWLGGLMYDMGKERWGSRASFQVLVLVGSVLTACCWLIVPLLPATSDPGDGESAG